MSNYQPPQDEREYGGGGRGENNYYNSTSSFPSDGTNPVREQQTSGLQGQPVSFSRDFSSVLAYAQSHHGTNNDDGLFGKAVEFLGNRFGDDSGKNDVGTVNEAQAIQAHQAVYGGNTNTNNTSGGETPHDTKTLAVSAALQALKLFTSQNSSTSSNSQQEFIGLAMAQASKLFDAKTTEGKVAESADKQSVVNQAAEMALKMYANSHSGSSIAGLAAKFL